MNPETLAAQLRCPNGAEATDVALGMNTANGPLNQQCISLLQLLKADQVLEIGPGNAAFAADIINAAADIHYTGLDWSNNMVTEALRLNARAVTQGKAEFLQGSSDELPFETASFSKVLTVHTLYFWQKPEAHLTEIRRVLKPDGLFCLAFGDREFMKDLPFTPFGFNLYGLEEFKAVLHQCGLKVLDARQILETGRSNTGALVDKRINIFLCSHD